MDENGDGFDGFIISLPGTDAVMEEIARSDIPTVLVNITDRRLAARAKSVSTVWFDNADAGRCAAKHLLEQGAYRSAGFVHDHGIPFYSTERLSAFRQTMKKAKLETSVFSDCADALKCVPPALPCAQITCAEQPAPPRDARSARGTESS